MRLVLFLPAKASAQDSIGSSAFSACPFSPSAFCPELPAALPAAISEAPASALVGLYCGDVGL